jgi:hypothetical protein
MSSDAFHIHGPHDHELQHAAAKAHHADAFAGKIAVATAVLATVGALFSYMGGATQSHAGLYKNNAAIKKTEAANQWNFYQAKSQKQNLAELGAALSSGERKATFEADADRYRNEKGAIKAAAERLEAEAKTWDAQSDAQLHEHHRWAQATTALQISIALAAIALLTRRKWLEWGVYGVAGVGMTLGVAAAMHL